MSAALLDCVEFGLNNHTRFQEKTDELVCNLNVAGSNGWNRAHPFFCCFLGVIWYVLKLNLNTFRLRLKYQGRENADIKIRDFTTIKEYKQGEL